MTTKTISLKISGSGIASIGMRSLKERRELYNAKAAISCLHDALLAVAKGMLSAEEVKDFFWHTDIESAEFIGGVLKFQKEPSPLTTN